MNFVRQMWALRKTRLSSSAPDVVYEKVKLIIQTTAERIRKFDEGCFHYLLERNFGLYIGISVAAYVSVAIIVANDQLAVDIYGEFVIGDIGIPGTFDVETIVLCTPGGVPVAFRAVIQGCLRGTLNFRDPE